MSRVTGTFTETGQSDSVVGGLLEGPQKNHMPAGLMTMSLSGFGGATVALQRSFDDGTTWLTVESYTVDTEVNIETPAHSTLYRLNCTAHASGTIAYMLGR
jgi:hypothetical protein